jgi:hypothetical protein
MSGPKSGGTVAVNSKHPPLDPIADHYRLPRQVALRYRPPGSYSLEAGARRREMARKFFDHEQFNFELQFALGGVHYGAGDIGEMLSTADRVIDGDADSW